METMSAKERVIRTLEGKPVDRIPTMSFGIEEKTFYEVNKKPLMSRLLSDDTMLNLPGAKFVLDHWAPKISNLVFRPGMMKMWDILSMTQVEMGFDAIWGCYDDSMIMLDSKSFTSPTGAIFNLVPDGCGNIRSMYSKPGITTPEEFDAWPYWPDTDDMAHRVYNFFKKITARYGEKVCICGNGAGMGLQEAMNCTFGIDKVPIWIKKHPAYVKRYLDIHEEMKMKTNAAMLDHGVPVICHSDDFAYKTGPFLNPKIIDSVFSPYYKRIFKYVKDRGAMTILHSCGDNTKLFDIFLSWGVDGLHAYEPTSNVDIFNEKKIHGDQVTMIGGMGIDYLLTAQSKDEEVVDRVKELCQRVGPGGKYIIAPTNCVDSMSAHKIKVMIDATKEYGKYPINVN